MKTIIYRRTHVGPCLVKIRDASFEPIVLAPGEVMMETYERIVPDKIDCGPEYEMYKDSPPPWMID